MMKHRILTEHRKYLIRQFFRKIGLRRFVKYRGWRKIRQDVLRRDNYTCQKCNVRRRKHNTVHHIDGNRKNNNLDNLITLCDNCHKKQHGVINEDI